MLQQRLGLRQLSGLVGQLGLHEQQVEIFRRAARHGLQFGQGAVVIAAIGQLAGQHQAHLARIGIAVDIGAGLGLRALRIHLGAVFQHALGGRLGFGIGGQGCAGLLGGPLVVARGGGHVRQRQVRGGQLAHVVAQGFVQDAQGQAAVVEPAQHGQRLADGGGFVAGGVDAVAQRLRQALGLAIGRGQRQFGGTSLDVVGGQTRPDTGCLQRAGQVAAGELEFQGAAGQPGIAGVPGQAEHGGRCGTVHTALRGDLGCQHTIKDVGGQRHIG
ncbi:hypothetical protein D9M68_686500 [compost metagenome]